MVFTKFGICLVNLHDVTSMLTNEQLGYSQHMSGLLHPQALAG